MLDHAGHDIQQIGQQFHIRNRPEGAVDDQITAIGAKRLAMVAAPQSDAAGAFRISGRRFDHGERRRKAKIHDLDWERLMREAKVRDAQNRLGFIVTLGRRIAGKRGGDAAQSKLREVEEQLEQARLAREDSLCQGGLSEKERRWLRRVRFADARHWNLLTDLDAEHLPYAA